MGGVAATGRRGITEERIRVSREHSFGTDVHAARVLLQHGADEEQRIGWAEGSRCYGVVTRMPRGQRRHTACLGLGGCLQRRLAKEERSIVSVNRLNTRLAPTFTLGECHRDRESEKNKGQLDGKRTLLPGRDRDARVAATKVMRRAWGVFR